MEQEPDHVLVAVEDQRLRDHLTRELAVAGYVPEVLHLRRDLLRRVPLSTVLILETNDDVAALTQTVYELYTASGVEQALPIIVLLSRDAAKRNPRVAMWDVGGHAAVAAIVTPDRKDANKEILEFVRRLKPNRGA